MQSAQHQLQVDRVQKAFRLNNKTTNTAVERNVLVFQSIFRDETELRFLDEALKARRRPRIDPVCCPFAPSASKAAVSLKHSLMGLGSGRFLTAVNQYQCE